MRSAWCVWAALLGACLALKQQIYHNEFAVHVPDGPDHVDRIAAKHGFVNRGQIGSLKGYYLLSHHEIRKRSLNASLDHNTRLQREPQVRWVMQQHERRRLKRDYGPDAELVWAGRHRPYHRALVQSNPFFPDPLYKEQWYLNGGAKDGLDMNVQPAWARGYTGKGVVVSILDDGIQTNHPDLAQNYDPIASTDINDSDEDPTPRDNGDNKHGTRCAGEVAAVAYNLICGVGVAYNASVGGVRMLDGIVNDAVEARALGLNPDHVDIYSASWGPEDDGKTVDGPGPLARRAFIYGVTTGRRGRGSIFVWASGNGGRHTDSCNCDGYTNSIFTLSISSATQGGFKPWYLEECSSTLASTYSSGTPGHDKSVATVDMDGRLRPDHICTVEHTGTSASAPLAAGICALALEANPNLTWRDMQHLVVMSSRSHPLEKEGGWVVNGVKRKVSHKFGYGLMDAAAMVSLAEKWTTVPPQHICKSQELLEDRGIDPAYGFTLTTHMDVTGCRGTVNDVKYLEHVQCKISLRFFPRGNLKILLTSPAGTTSVLLFERPRDIVSSNFDEWPFLSVHYWGEAPEGRWTLQIVNSGNRHVNQPGVLKKWQLIFYGTTIDPVRLRKATVNVAPPPFAFPTAGDAFETVPTGGEQFFGSDAYANYQNYPLFAAGSEPEKAIAALDGSPAPEHVDTMENADQPLDHDCDTECESMCYGSGPKRCVSCRNFKMDDTCVSQCPPKSYISLNKVCMPCHESCDTCVGGGQDVCLSCAPHHVLVADLGVCLQQCPDGYFEDRALKKCVPCAPHCSQCSDGADTCTACEGHLVLVGNTCLAACPAGTYETPDETCMACDSSCETCSGPGEKCVTCRTSHYEHEGTCVASCPPRYYADKKRKECMPCDAGCVSCSSSECLECEAGWIVNRKGRCVPQGNEHCQPAEYYSPETKSCKPCTLECAACISNLPRSCIACRSPFLLQDGGCIASCAVGGYAEGAKCVRCPHGCSKCASRLNCTECDGELKMQSGVCVTQCAKGYYADRSTCARCHLACETCSSGRRDRCASCPAGWRLAAGECLPDCPDGFHRAGGECRRCHTHCRLCSDAGPLACTACRERAYLDNGTCVECAQSQYYDASTRACVACHRTCAQCSGGSAFACLACQRPLTLDRLNRQCVPCCDAAEEASSPSPEPSIAPSCCRCDSNGECRHSSAAGKRRIADGAVLGAGGGGGGGSLLQLVLLAAGVAALAAVVIVALMQRTPKHEYSKSEKLSGRYARVACDADDSRCPGQRHEHEPLLEAYT